MNLGALSSPGYRRYFVGNVFALNGMWLSRITIAWIAWAMTGQASFVGLVAFLIFAPTLVSGPFFGVLADRIALKHAAIVTQTLLASCTLALLAFSIAGILSPALLAGLALAIGIVSSAHHPIRLALAPSLVPRATIGSAVALGSINFNLARLTGPAIGGAIIAQFGEPAALTLSAACFVPLIALLPGIAMRPSRQPPRDVGILAALRDGIAYALRAPLIRRAMIVTGLFSLVGRGILEILPVVADGVHGRGPTGLGVLTAAAGAGALAAAALVTLGPRQVPGQLPRASRAAAGMGLALVMALAWSPSWPLAVACVAALGLCGTFVGVGMQTSVQLVLEDEYRARVMSLWTMLAIGGAALGAIALGVLVDALGYQAALTGAAILGLLVGSHALATPLAAAPPARTSAGHHPALQRGATPP